MVTIRHYIKSDFPMISKWWTQAGEIGPLETMMPLDSTFILEIDSVPALCVSLFLTNITEYCLVENFIGNTELKGQERRSASHLLLSYLENFAHEKGYKRLFCLAHREPLKQRYKELGFEMTGDHVASFVKTVRGE